MSKKYIALIVVTVLVVVGLASVGVYKYEHRAKTPTQESVAQLQTANKTLQSELTVMQSHSAVDQANLGQDQNALTTLQTQKVQLCAILTSHKLTSPDCN